MARELTAGDLSHRATIQVPTEVADSAGQMIPSWEDECEVWCLYEQTGGAEVQVGEQVRSVITGTVTARANPAFNAKRRLKISGWGFTDLIVNIVAVHRPNPNTGLQTVVVQQPADGITQ